MEKLEIGKIINIHGVRGELKCELWTDPEAVLSELPALWVADAEYPVIGWRLHKNFLLLWLEGVSSVEAANALRGKVLWVPRDKVEKEAGFFFGDLFGFAVYDQRTRRELGVLSAVEELPQGYLYVVRQQDGTEILIPARPEFTVRTDFENRRLEVRTIEGMLPDEN